MDKTLLPYNLIDLYFTVVYHNYDIVGVEFSRDYVTLSLNEIYDYIAKEGNCKIGKEESLYQVIKKVSENDEATAECPYVENPGWALDPGYKSPILYFKINRQRIPTTSLSKVFKQGDKFISVKSTEGFPGDFLAGIGNNVIRVRKYDYNTFECIYPDIFTNSIKESYYYFDKIENIGDYKVTAADKSVKYLENTPVILHSYAPGFPPFTYKGYSSKQLSLDAGVDITDWMVRSQIYTNRPEFASYASFANSISNIVPETYWDTDTDKTLENFVNVLKKFYIDVVEDMDLGADFDYSKTKLAWVPYLLRDLGWFVNTRDDLWRFQTRYIFSLLKKKGVPDYLQRFLMMFLIDWQYSEYWRSENKELLKYDPEYINRNGFYEFFPFDKPVEYGTCLANEHYLADTVIDSNKNFERNELTFYEKGEKYYFKDSRFQKFEIVENDSEQLVMDTSEVVKAPSQKVVKLKTATFKNEYSASPDFDDKLFHVSPFSDAKNVLNGNIIEINGGFLPRVEVDFEGNKWKDFEASITFTNTDGEDYTFSNLSVLGNTPVPSLPETQIILEEEICEDFNFVSEYPLTSDMTRGYTYSALLKDTVINDVTFKSSYDPIYLIDDTIDSLIDITNTDNDHYRIKVSLPEILDKSIYSYVNVYAKNLADTRFDKIYNKVGGVYTSVDPTLNTPYSFTDIIFGSTRPLKQIYWDITTTGTSESLSFFVWKNGAWISVDVNDLSNGLYNDNYTRFVTPKKWAKEVCTDLVDTTELYWVKVTKATTTNTVVSYFYDEESHLINIMDSALIEQGYIYDTFTDEELSYTPIVSLTLFDSTFNYASIKLDSYGLGNENDEGFFGPLVGNFGYVVSKSYSGTVKPKVFVPDVFSWINGLWSRGGQLDIQDTDLTRKVFDISSSLKTISASGETGNFSCHFDETVTTSIPNGFYIVGRFYNDIWMYSPLIVNSATQSITYSLTDKEWRLVTGYFKDENGLPVEGACIGTSYYSTTTDNTGLFRLMVPQDETVTLTYSRVLSNVESFTSDLKFLTSGGTYSLSSSDNDLIFNVTRDPFTSYGTLTVNTTEAYKTLYLSQTGLESSLLKTICTNVAGTVSVDLPAGSYTLYLDPDQKHYDKVTDSITIVNSSTTTSTFTLVGADTSSYDITFAYQKMFVSDEFTDETKDVKLSVGYQLVLTSNTSFLNSSWTSDVSKSESGISRSFTAKLALGELHDWKIIPYINTDTDNYLNVSFTFRYNDTNILYAYDDIHNWPKDYFKNAKVFTLGNGVSLSTSADREQGMYILPDSDIIYFSVFGSFKYNYYSDIYVNVEDRNLITPYDPVFYDATKSDCTVYLQYDSENEKWDIKLKFLNYYNNYLHDEVVLYSYDVSGEDDKTDPTGTYTKSDDLPVYIDLSQLASTLKYQLYPITSKVVASGPGFLNIEEDLENFQGSCGISIHTPTAGVYNIVRESDLEKRKWRSQLLGLTRIPNDLDAKRKCCFFDMVYPILGSEIVKKSPTDSITLMMTLYNYNMNQKIEINWDDTLCFIPQEDFTFSREIESFPSIDFGDDSDVDVTINFSFDKLKTYCKDKNFVEMVAQGLHVLRIKTVPSDNGWDSFVLEIPIEIRYD